MSYDRVAEPFIQLRNVTKAYEEGRRPRVVFQGLNARLQRGGVTVLMGRSGTGKSTLLNLISGIDIPDAGDVVLGGVVLNRLSEKDRTLVRRRRIGFVFQFFNLIPTLTVEENLMLPLELVRETGRNGRERVRALLHRVGLADRLDSYPDQLSGGEQQRVAIVRALAHAPDLILADEPTGNLDAETGRHALALLTGLTREADKTLLMVTHSGEAAGSADRVLAIEDGSLVERSSPGAATERHG